MIKGICSTCKNSTSRKSTIYCKSCYLQILKKRFSQRGEKSINWKGGTHINSWGYLRYNPSYSVNSGRFVHVVVMEQKLGRKINSKFEKVHHINGKKLDNRPENLQLVDIKTHNKIHKPHLMNIRHPIYGYYIKKQINLGNYQPHHLKRSRDIKTGRFL